MNKHRGFVLIFSLLVTLTLSLLLTSFYAQNVNESNLAKKYSDSTRAFWLAEAGLANVYASFPSPSSGSLGGANYTYNATVASIGGNYYTVTSTGTVTNPTGSSISRVVTATVKTGAVDPTKFQYGIETTTDLVIKGSAAINPSESWKEYSTLDFSNLFGVSKAQVQAGATHTYTPATFGDPVSGITWVDVPTGDTFNIASNLVGSGLLVINGDTRIAGTVDFSGIIYVIGSLHISGTVNTYGSVLAESSTEVDTSMTGNVTINYDIDRITEALAFVSTLNKQIVSWKSD